MIEKTPDNCLRVDFIRKIFPDAYFIYIQRDGRNSISSMMEAWRHYRKIPYSDNVRNAAKRIYPVDEKWRHMNASSIESLKY
jgi:hypothetical protein